MVVLINIDNVVRDLNHTISLYYDEFRNDKDVIYNNDVVDDDYVETKIIDNTEKKYQLVTDYGVFDFINEDEFIEFRQTYLYEMLVTSIMNENFKSLFDVVTQKGYNVIYYCTPNNQKEKPHTFHYLIKNNLAAVGFLFGDNWGIRHLISDNYQIYYRDNKYILQYTDNEGSDEIIEDNKNLQKIIDYFKNKQYDKIR